MWIMKRSYRKKYFYKSTLTISFDSDCENRKLFFLTRKWADGASYADKICPNINLKAEGMSQSDQEIRDVIDTVFAVFDKDGNNELDQNEVHNFITAALRQMGEEKELSQAEVQEFMKEVDRSGDGKIQKNELFEIFKRCL